MLEYTLLLSITIVLDVNIEYIGGVVIIKAKWPLRLRSDHMVGDKRRIAGQMDGEAVASGHQIDG